MMTQAEVLQFDLYIQSPPRAFLAAARELLEE